MDKNKVIEAAAKLVQKGAYDKAIKEYQKVLDADPKDVRVLQKMGELYQKKNENGLAATFFSRVAETYAGDGFFLKAVALYKQVLKLSPGLVEINLKLAELHQQLGLISEAMAYFQIVANHYDKVGDAKSSLDTLKRMVDLDPENVASRIKLAELYARENIRDPAVEEFRRAAEYLQRHNRTDDYLRVAERITALVPDDVALARELASAYLQRGDQKRALAKLQLCFKADPRDIQTLTLLAEAFQGLGQTSKTLSVCKELAKIYQETDQAALGEGVWNKIATLDPHDPDLLARRGGPAAVATSSPAAAVTAPAYTPAAPAPTYAPATATVPARVQSFPAPAQPQAAAPAARPATQVAPSPRESLAKLLTETDVYVKYGLHDKALEHLRKVFAVDPENLEAHEKAYHIYVSAQHGEEAGDQLLNVLRLMTRRGEVERAQPYLRAVLQQNPRHPEVPAFLAVLQMQGADLSSPEQLQDDAILVDANDEEVVVADPPPDALVAAPEDLALASQGAPEELVEEPSAELHEDAVVLSPEEEAGWGEDEPLSRNAAPARSVPAPPAPAPISARPARRAMPAAPTPAPVASRSAVLTPPPPAPIEARPTPSRALVPPVSAPPEPAQARRPAVAPSPPRGRAPSPPAPAPVVARPPPAAARRPAVVEEEDSVAQEIEEAGFLLEQGLTDEARDILETVLLAKPGHPRATELLERLEAGAAAAALSDPEALVDDSQETGQDAFDLAAELAEEMGPADGVAIESAGDDFQYSVEEVFEEFKKGLEKVVKPEDVDTHYDLGIAYKEMGLIDDAIQEFNVARQGCLKKKKEIDCLTMMALLQTMKGDHAAAVSSYQQALTSDFATGEMAKSLEYELGVAWEASGNQEKALTHLTKVASQDPGYRGVTDLVTRLKASAPKTRKVGYLVTYLDFFGLTQEPFSNAPVSRFYYNSTQHSQALIRLMHSVSSMKGLSILIGDIGAGKTTLARRMLDSLPESEYEAALLVIIHSGITANWLLRRIALQLGVESPAQEKLALLSQLYQRLLAIYESGKKAVVLIDEAQMLETRELMEEFRGLLNLEVPERKLISFVFFGLPEVERNLKLDPPLAQRVALRYRLEPFAADSTEAYIKHRLRLAGSPRMPFSPDAIAAIHAHSGGTPRVINTLCDNALFESFLARQETIEASLVSTVSENLGLNAGLPPQAELAPLVPANVPPPPPLAGPPGLPPARQLQPKVDLAEIDRYLEALGKL